MLGVRGITVIGHGRSNPERHQECYPGGRRALPFPRERENRTGAFRSRSNPRPRLSLGIAINMSKLAFLFPGQASQYPGMGRDLAENFPESRAVFDEADAGAGLRDFEGVLRGRRRSAEADGKHAARDPDRFRGGVSRAGKHGDHAGFCRRAQFGGIFRARRRGRFDFFDAVKLVRKRGEYMQEAVPGGRGRDGRDSGAFRRRTWQKFARRQRRKKLFRRRI